MLKLFSHLAALLLLFVVPVPALAEGAKPSIVKKAGAAAAKKAASVFRNNRATCYANSDYLIVTETGDDGSERILVRKIILSAKKPRCAFSLKEGDWMPAAPGAVELTFVALSEHRLALKVFDPSGVHLPRVQILDLKTQEVVQEVADIFEMDIAEASAAGFPFWRDSGLEVNRDNCPEYADQAENEDSAIGVPHVLRKLKFSFASQQVSETSETWCLLDVD